MSQDEQDTNIPSSDNTPSGNDQRSEQPAAEGNQGNSNTGDFQGQVGSVGIGPGTQIHNYYGLKVEDWIRITDDLYRSRREEKGSDAGSNKQKELQDPLARKLKENLEFDLQDSTYDGLGQTESRDTTMLQTPEQLATWYYKLTSYERCFVLAAAIFHGMYTETVSNAASELHKSLTPQKPSPRITS